MQILKIYSKYKTLPNLQLHMLRVGALAQIITNNWVGEIIDKESIIKTCLLHDIAKPINFDMTNQKQYIKDDNELIEIEECNNFLISNYGVEEHPALEMIGKEIGVSEKSLELLKNLEWHYIKKLLANNDIESLIPIYADMRISPNGIVSIIDRVEDLKKRTGKENNQQFEYIQKLESLINENTKANLYQITNQEINIMIKNFKNYNI